MRSSTVVLQAICVALGLLFLFFGLSTQAAIGGLLIGSVMFFAAALLGADHTTNANPRSRRIFKAMVVLSSVPFAVASMGASLRLWRSGEWGDLAVTLLRLAGFAFLVLLLAFDHHPFVQRQIRKLGLSSPKE